jgi:DNA integrity scanning protein DisA with diadenylate cyclase activity
VTALPYGYVNSPEDNTPGTSVGVRVDSAPELTRFGFVSLSQFDGCVVLSSALFFQKINQAKITTVTMPSLPPTENGIV